MDDRYPNIPKDEIKNDPTSYIDPNGRVFEWKGEIYRGITKNKDALYRKLNDGLIKRLCSDKLLIDTEITPYSLEGFSFVLRHRRVKTISYCVEWPPVAFKKAALLTLELNIRLLEEGFILQDAYPWNVYFEGTKPVFIDFGSIENIDESVLWVAYEQFCNFFLFPLYLSSARRGNVVRAMLYDYLQGITREDFLKLDPFGDKILHPMRTINLILGEKFGKLIEGNKNFKKKFLDFSRQMHQKTASSKVRLSLMRNMRKKIENINIKVNQSDWLEYYGENSVSLKYADDDKRKQEVVGGILEKLRPETLLDIGCNRGLYSILAARKGCSVIAFDRDENCISSLFNYAEEANLDILPLLMDVNNPTPSFGWCAIQFPSALERFKCDMVFALALIHHMVFRQWQNFDRITETLSGFSRKWLLLEFIYKEDEMIDDWYNDRFDWYTLQNLQKAVSKYYKTIELFDSDRPTRKLLLCKK